MDFEIGDYVEFDRNAREASLVDESLFGRVFKIKNVIHNSGGTQLIINDNETIGSWAYRFKLVKKGKMSIFKNELRKMLNEI